MNPFSSIFETLREQVVSLQETHVFSASALNIARVGFSRGAFFFTGETSVDVPGWIAGAPIGAVVIGGSTASDGATQLSLAGTNVGNNLRVVRNLFTYEDNVDITRSIHHWQAGVWLQRMQSNDLMAQAQNGQATFSSVVGLLQGQVTNFTAVPTPTPLGWRSLEGAFYVQDTMKLTPNLELSLGFRDEFTNGWNEAHGRASNYDFVNGVNPYRSVCRQLRFQSE